jgi:hypothetical protein
MRRHFSVLLTVSLIAWCESSLACSIIPPPPEERFSESQVVVLAVPLAISYRPREAAKRDFVGRYRQTILWQVLIRWKGPFRAGTKFTTRRNYSEGVGDPELACTSYVTTKTRTAQLLYLQGREPFEEFHGSGVEASLWDFEYLEKAGRQ